MSTITIFALVSIMAALGITTAAIGTGVVYQQANAETSDNANQVAKEISRHGTSPNQDYQTTCKETSSASNCATEPLTGNGPYTSKLAHRNGH
jgi:hypothetical protein